MIEPKQPVRPLIWTNTMLDLCDFLALAEEQVYVVGGAVRDAYLHHPIKDIDLATPDNAIKLGRFIANKLNGDFYVLDAERDVARVLLDTLADGRIVIDIAHFRGDDLLSDLQGRDFTFNAMAVDLKGDVSFLLDPLNGEEDLAKRIVRRCSPRSLPDDPIRALRAVRQSIQFNARIEPETLKDVRMARESIWNTSAERVRDEFFKILSVKKPAMALRVADKLGLLGVIVPETDDLHDMPQSAPHVFDGWQHTLMVVERLHNILTTISPYRTDETAAVFDLGVIVMALDRYRSRLQAHIDTSLSEGRSHWALLLFAALMHDAGKPQTAEQDDSVQWHFYGHEKIGAEMIEQRADILRLSNVESQRLAMIVKNHMRPLVLENPSKRSVHRFWHSLGEAGIDVCLLSLADYLGTYGMTLKQDDWLAHLERIRHLLEAYFDQYEQIVAPPSLVDGRQLMAELDLEPGALIGELLTLIREGQAAGEINTVDEALTTARQYVQSNKS